MEVNSLMEPREVKPWRRPDGHVHGISEEEFKRVDALAGQVIESAEVVEGIDGAGVLLTLSGDRRVAILSSEWLLVLDVRVDADGRRTFIFDA
jgi:hypothetical protein